MCLRTKYNINSRIDQHNVQRLDKKRKENLNKKRKAMQKSYQITKLSKNYKNSKTAPHTF